MLRAIGSIRWAVAAAAARHKGRVGKFSMSMTFDEVVTCVYDPAQVVVKWFITVQHSICPCPIPSISGW